MRDDDSIYLDILLQIIEHRELDDRTVNQCERSRLLSGIERDVFDDDFVAAKVEVRLAYFGANAQIAQTAGDLVLNKQVEPTASDIYEDRND